jgi:hypothetical protein
MTLFRRLPDTIFYPLAGPNRALFEEVLTRLYELFFGSQSSAQLPVHEVVRGEIDEALTAFALKDWTPEEEDSDPVELVGYSNLLSWRVYHRLVKTGWLEEEQDKYVKRVLMPPDAGLVLGVLVDIKLQRQNRYGGVVQSLLSILEQVKLKPSEQAAALNEAARMTKTFIRHMRSIAYGLRELDKTLKGTKDHRKMLGTFFADFVTNYLIADYKTLHTKDNPFRFRSDILKIVRELKFNDEGKKALADGYLRQGFTSKPSDAWGKVLRDLDEIESAFDEVDIHLENIDSHRSRLEQRVAESVRYLDKTQPGAAARIAHILQSISGLDETALAEIELCHRLMPVNQLSPRSPRPPTSVKRPPAPEPIRRRVPDPERIEQQIAVREYLSKRHVNPKMLAAYLNRQMGDEREVVAKDLMIETVEDFIAFSHLRFVAHMGQAGRAVTEHFNVEVLKGVVDNIYIRCDDFRITRRF